MTSFPDLKKKNGSLPSHFPTKIYYDLIINILYFSELVDENENHDFAFLSLVVSQVGDTENENFNFLIYCQ